MAKCYWDRMAGIYPGGRRHGLALISAQEAVAAEDAAERRETAPWAREAFWFRSLWPRGGFNCKSVVLLQSNYPWRITANPNNAKRITGEAELHSNNLLGFVFRIG